MRRREYPLIITVVVGLVLAACASPAGSGEPGASSGSAPSAAAEASQGSDGGGGGGGEVSLPDGAWTGGHASASISGDATLTVDADLFPATSISDNGNTFLQYVSADGRQIAVAIYPDPYSVATTIVTAEISGGGATDGGQCEASFSRTDDNALEGQIHCDDTPAVTATGGGQSIDIDLTFTATR